VEWPIKVGSTQWENPDRAVLPDEGLLFKTFLDSYRQAPPCRVMPSGSYFRAYHHALEQLLSAGDTVVHVAHSPEDREGVFGWAAGTRHRLYYVYTKEIYRGNDVATRLIMSVCDTGQALRHVFSTRGGLALLRKICARPPILDLDQLGNILPASCH